MLDFVAIFWKIICIFFGEKKHEHSHISLTVSLTVNIVSTNHLLLTGNIDKIQAVNLQPPVQSELWFMPLTPLTKYSLTMTYQRAASISVHFSTPVGNCLPCYHFP